eukprot:3128487-Karenia_brevis.AAC.1
MHHPVVRGPPTTQSSNGSLLLHEFGSLPPLDPMTLATEVQTHLDEPCFMLNNGRPEADHLFVLHQTHANPTMIVFAVES